jgi:hypothetical protein
MWSLQSTIDEAGRLDTPVPDGHRVSEYIALIARLGLLREVVGADADLDVVAGVGGARMDLSL